MYTVFLDAQVFEKDFRKIDKHDQQRIIKTIRKKLTTNLELYGKPLSGNLRGYWKLKIGHYRVVYQVLKREIRVYVVAVGFRRDAQAYLEAAKRLGIL